MKDIAKLALLLTVVCMLNGLALGIVYNGTKAAIDRSAEAHYTASLKQVLPRAVRFSERKVLSLPDGRTIGYCEGYSESGELAGYAIEGQRQGYQSLLRVLVGIDPCGVIEGVNVFQQAETPGLGARVAEAESGETLWSRIAGLYGGGKALGGETRPWFQEQFEGLRSGDLRLLGASESGKGVHAITGATITSRAVTDAVRDAVSLFIREKGNVS